MTYFNTGIGAFYGKTDEGAAYKALTYAADRGMTFWDCADIYGTSMNNNLLISHYELIGHKQL